MGLAMFKIPMQAPVACRPLYHIPCTLLYPLFPFSLPCLPHSSCLSTSSCNELSFQRGRCLCQLPLLLPLPSSLSLSVCVGVISVIGCDLRLIFFVFALSVACTTACIPLAMHVAAHCATARPTLRGCQLWFSVRESLLERPYLEQAGRLSAS